MATQQFHPFPPIVASIPQNGGDPIATEETYTWTEYSWGVLAGCVFRVHLNPRPNFRAVEIRWTNESGEQKVYRFPHEVASYAPGGWTFYEPSGGSAEETIISDVVVVYEPVQRSGLILRSASTGVILRSASTGAILRDA